MVSKSNKEMLVLAFGPITRNRKGDADAALRKRKWAVPN